MLRHIDCSFAYVENISLFKAKHAIKEIKPNALAVTFTVGTEWVCCSHICQEWECQRAAVEVRYIGEHFHIQ